MIRAFLDASILYAALVSQSGASRELLRRHVSGEVKLVISVYVVDETRRNLTNKQPDLAQSLELLLDILMFETVEVPIEAIREAATYTVLKDAPVIAAARSSGCEYLLTFDKQHLLNHHEIASRSSLLIITPGELMRKLRGQS
jgi:predicted nucleic acid-binding protein